MRYAYNLHRLRQRSYLIRLHEHRIGDTVPYSMQKAFRICDKEIVPHERDLFAEPFGQANPAFAVVLAERVLNRGYRKFSAEFLYPPDRLIRREAFSGFWQDVSVALLPFRSRHVKCYLDPSGIPRLFNCIGDIPQRLAFIPQIRRKAALVADPSALSVGGREFVIQVKGQVSERSSKNANLPTGDIEIIVSELNVLNTALTPPFTIEDNTDGGDDLRMKYRYLDLRRTAVRKNLELRHRMTMEVRRYLDSKGFLEVETPMLIGSTPEGARDFVVPSRMNPGQFYALPQSPQTLKQLLMVSGFDRYFQIVKCFRDEDLRADRQPEFTQIDCEMSFVEQEDIIQMFE